MKKFLIVSIVLLIISLITVVVVFWLVSTKITSTNVSVSDTLSASIGNFNTKSETNSVQLG